MPENDAAAPVNTEEAPVLNVQTLVEQPASTLAGNPVVPDDNPILSAEEKPENPQEAGAPESYADFTLSEGFALEDARKNEMTALFRENNLSQAQAQKFVDAFTRFTSEQAAREAEQAAESRKEWRKELRARPTFEADRALALKGLRALAKTPETKALFDNTWLTDHPAVFDLLAQAGRLVSEDTIPTAPSASPALSEGAINLQRFPVK